MNKFWVILKETYRKNVQSIGFIVMVLSPLLILGIGLGIGYYVTNTQEENLPIAVVTENSEIKDVLSSEGIEIEPTIQSEDQAKDALANETIEAYAVILQENDSVEVDYVTSESTASPTAELVRGALTLYQTQLRGNKLNLSSQDLERLTTPITFEENYVSIEDGIVEPEDQAEYEGSFIKQGAAYLISIGIFIFVMTYASIIAQEIASEKGTRIMEVILSSVSSSVHFFGKLLGILLVCLTQITLYIVIGLIAYTQLKNIHFVQNILSLIDFSQLDTAFIGSSAILFALGIILFVVLAAFFGSLVTKIEDVNKAVTPVVYIALAGFYGGLFAFTNAEHLVVAILSYIPFFTPFVMPFRVAAETVSSSGIWLSVGTTFLFTIFITWISLMMYRSNVLVYSDTGLFKTMKRSWGILRSERRSERQ